MNDIKKVLVGSAAFSVLGIISLFGGSASAATINVQNEVELRNAIDQVNTSITEDTVISIGGDISTSTAFEVNKTNAHNVLINGNDHNLQATINLNSSGGGTFTFDHLNMDGKKTVRAGINMKNFFSDVIIQNSKFQNLDNTAVDTTTSGNELLVKNTLFKNNKSAGGGAMNFSNTRNVTVENSTFQERGWDKTLAKIKRTSAHANAEVLLYTNLFSFWAMLFAGTASSHFSGEPLKWIFSSCCSRRSHAHTSINSV